MSTERDLRYLNYIGEAIELIARRTQNGYDAFRRDIDAQDAVLWRLETLAEATAKLSEDLKRRHPEIRWHAVRGFRNIAAHGYLDLNFDLVWEIVDVHLTELKAVVEAELAGQGRSQGDSPG